MEMAAQRDFRVGLFKLGGLLPANHVFFGFEAGVELDSEKVEKAYQECLAELGIGGSDHHSCWLTPRMMFVVVRTAPSIKTDRFTLDVNSLGYTGNFAVRN